MADDNRTINICLINTNKKTNGLPDNNRVGIDHINSFIWFDDKAQRDNYMALKTVHSQTENSKIKDFNDPQVFRIAMKMKDYYELDVDLVKVSHTINGLENEYFYNIDDVDYENNAVVVLSVSINDVYTYFLDNSNERNQYQGVVTKSNFKNQNVTADDINIMGQSVIGDNYGAGEYTGGVKKIVKYEDKFPSDLSWFVISLRKKPNIIDDAMNESVLKGTMHNSFSDEIVMSLPFLNETGKVAPMIFDDDKKRFESTGTISYISYLFLNGSLKVDNKKGFLGKLVQQYQYLTDMPFTIGSFYDIQEIGIVPDYPGDYEKVLDPAGWEVHFKGKGNSPDYITLKDNMTEKEVKVPYVTYANVNNKLRLEKFPIITNKEKAERLCNGFENIENNIVYNKYQLKYFNVLVDLNPFNLFGSDQDVFVSTMYLGNTFKKLLVSTDINLEGLDIKDQVSGVGNTDFVIKYQGKVEDGSDLGSATSDMLLGAVDLIAGIAGTALGGPAGGGVASYVSSKVTGGIEDLTKQFQVKGGSSGYNSQNSYASALYYDLEEFIPKIVYMRSSKVRTIDTQTNYLGTSCSLYTPNLHEHVKNTINNRTNRKCYIAGDFNVNYLYPQANDRLKNIFANGIIFMKKLTTFYSENEE